MPVRSIPALPTAWPARTGRVLYDILCYLQILRYAEYPDFVDIPGNSKNLGWAINDEEILRDAVASAYLGCPVAWHSLYSQGKESRDWTREGQNLNDVWQAHAELATKVIFQQYVHKI